MTEPANPLRDLVVRRLAALGSGGKPLPYKAAAMRSGGRISHEVIRRIALGVHSNRLPPEKIEGLARALGMPVADVYEAAKVPRPGSRWHWPARFDQLPDEDRRRLEDLAARMLALHLRAQRAD